MSILMSIGNFFLFMAGPVAIVFIIVGAYYYITAGGDEERGDKGKKSHYRSAGSYGAKCYSFSISTIIAKSYPKRD